jgi:RNA polymerase I-specific transcription initiation factor RRN3
MGENQGNEDNVPRDWYPFDPYTLPRSKGYVIDNFMEYAPSDGDEEMATDGDDSDTDEMDEDDM